MRFLDKFAPFALTATPADRVAAPPVAEYIANLECRLVDTHLVEKFNLFVLEVVNAWHDPAREVRKTIHHRGYGAFVVDGDTLQLDSRMP